MGRCSWAGSKAEAEGKNGLTLSGFGFGLTQIRGPRLPYPTPADFLVSFLSPYRDVSISDSVLFLPFPLYLSSFFLFWEFCGLKVPKTTDLRTIRKYLIFEP